ncbi:MAG: chromosome partitioning protein ParA, partial [Geminicoccaceae bacterium]|nr:chromosome partitioning protein ParA [Geminicoccaceae bacterium]
QAAERASAELAARVEGLATRAAALDAERQRRGERAARLAARERELGERLAREDPPPSPAAEDDERLAVLRTEAEAAETAYRAAAAEVDRLAAAVDEAERSGLEAEAVLAAAAERATLARAEEAAARSRLEAARAAVIDRLRQPPEALPPETVAEPLRALEVDALERRLARLVASRDRLGPVNLRAEQELAELERELERTRAEEAEIRSAIERLERAIATVNREARERLLAVYESVEGHFRRLFTRLFGGGRAHLHLTDLADPLAAGLELEAQPPGKRLAHVSLLSGGEKSLTGLALVFAFFLARPSPLCVLDEVDAPLDDANVDRFTELMSEIARTAGTRFLVVTHHPLTMARMDRLYGVTMAERGVSRLISVELGEAVELRARA